VAETNCWCVITTSGDELHLRSAFRRSQIGRYTIRFAHSSGSVAVQIRNKVVRDLANRRVLGNDDQARAAPRANELTEVTGHRRLVVRDQDAAVTRGVGENFLILKTGETR